jgi:CDP-diacylglycerol--serine O-phosphatidyltransferase
MRIRNSIPNFITLMNLLSGSSAIILAFSGEMIFASWLIILAAVLDFFDGLAARLLHAKSNIGAQLDSLADVISFGLAPSVVIYLLLIYATALPGPKTGEIFPAAFISLLIVAAGAYRLAKFNTDPRQETEFKGLPIPAAGLFIASLPLVLDQYGEMPGFLSIFNNFLTYLIIIVSLSWLMVSNIPMLSLKFSHYRWKGNVARYMVIGSGPVLFFFLKYSAIPVVIILYIFISVISSSQKNSNFNLKTL